MDFFKIINDIAAETRMNMGEKVRMLIRILVGISPKRIECHRRAAGGRVSGGEVPGSGAGWRDGGGKLRGENEDGRAGDYSSSRYSIISATPHFKIRQSWLTVLVEILFPCLML